MITALLSAALKLQLCKAGLSGWGFLTFESLTLGWELQLLTGAEKLCVSPQQSATLSTKTMVIIPWLCGPGVTYRWVWAVEKPADLILLLTFYHPGNKRKAETGRKAS